MDRLTRSRYYPYLEEKYKQQFADDEKSLLNLVSENELFLQEKLHDIIEADRLKDVSKVDQPKELSNDAGHIQASHDPSYTVDQGVATQGDLYQDSGGLLEKHALCQSNDVQEQPCYSVAAGQGHADHLLTTDGVSAKETVVQLQPDYDLSHTAAHYTAVQSDFHHGQGHDAALGELYQASDGVDSDGKSAIYQVRDVLHDKPDQEALYQDSANPQDEFVLSLSKYTPPDKPSDSPSDTVTAKAGLQDTAAAAHNQTSHDPCNTLVDQGGVIQGDLYQDSGGPQVKHFLHLSNDFQHQPCDIVAAGHDHANQPSDSVQVSVGEGVPPDQAVLPHDVLQHTAVQGGFHQGQSHTTGQGDIYPASDGLKGGATHGDLH